MYMVLPTNTLNPFDYHFTFYQAMDELFAKAHHHKEYLDMKYAQEVIYANKWKNRCEQLQAELEAQSAVQPGVETE